MKISSVSYYNDVTPPTGDFAPMATNNGFKTTYEIDRTIEPIYTGGEITATASGSLLATNVDGDVLLVDLNSGKRLLTVSGDGESITSVSLSPNGSYLVICSRSLSMRIFTVSASNGGFDAELQRTLKPHTSPVVSSAIDPSGTLLVTGGADGVTKVWDLRAGYCSHTFHGHGGLVTAVELFQSTKISARKSSSTSTRKRKVQASEYPQLTGITSDLTMLLATGGEDGKMNVWDLGSKKTVAVLDSHVSVVRSIRYSATLQTLLSASRDKTIVVWNTDSWQPQRIIPTLEVMEAAGFGPNGDFCYGGGENGQLRIWETATGKEMTDVQNRNLGNEAIVTIIHVPAEHALLTVHQDQSLVLRSYERLQDKDLEILRSLSGNHDEIIDMACVGPDRSLLALATNTENIKLVSIDEKASVLSNPQFGSDVALLTGHQDIIISMDVDWSGHWLATGGKDNTARLWRLDPHQHIYQCFAVFAGHTGSLSAVALPRYPPTDHATSASALEIPPPYLITGSQDKTIKKWDVSKLRFNRQQSEPYNVVKAAYTRVAHEKDINAIDISTNKMLFASASQDRTIKIWSLEDCSTTGILKGHKRGVWSINFSPLGIATLGLAEGGSSSGRGLIVSGSGDRSVKVWSLSTYTCLLTFEGHSNSVLKVIWLRPPGLDSTGKDQSGRHIQDFRQPVIASASSDTLVKIWTPYASPDSDPLLISLDNHTDRVWSLTSPHPVMPVSWMNEQTSLSYNFISGAADASLTFWTDTTLKSAEAASKAVTERIEEDQLLQNHIFAGQYRESIVLALKLNHPARLLRIFNDVLSMPEKDRESGSLTGKFAVDEVLANLSQNEVYLLLCCIRDWNINARTAPISQRLLNVLFRKYPTTMWISMARNRNLGKVAGADKQGVRGTRKHVSIRDLFRALEVYTERHYKRTEELVDESYLVEYTLREMDEVIGSSTVEQAR